MSGRRDPPPPTCSTAPPLQTAHRVQPRPIITRQQCYSYPVPSTQGITFADRGAYPEQSLPISLTQPATILPSASPISAAANVTDPPYISIPVIAPHLQGACQGSRTSAPYIKGSLSSQSLPSMAQFQSGPIPMNTQAHQVYNPYARPPYDPYMAPPPQEMARYQAPPSTQNSGGPHQAYNMPLQQPPYGPPAMYTTPAPLQNYGYSQQAPQATESGVYGSGHPAGVQYPLGEPVPRVSRDLYPQATDERRHQRSRSVASKRSHKSASSRKVHDPEDHRRRHRRHRSAGGSNRKSFSSESLDEDSGSDPSALRGASRRSRNDHGRKSGDFSRIDDSRPTPGGSLLGFGRSLKTIVTGKDYGSDY